MTGINEKKTNIKKNGKKNGAGWAAAQSRNCIAIQGSVLQEVAGLRGFCVAIQ